MLLAHFGSDGPEFNSLEDMIDGRAKRHRVFMLWLVEDAFGNIATTADGCEVLSIFHAPIRINSENVRLPITEYDNNQATIQVDFCDVGKGSDSD